MEHFWQGFEKEAAARWQKVWGTLSRSSKDKLRSYSGAGVRNTAAMREGMFLPKHAPAELAHQARKDALIYDNARRNTPNTLKLNSKAMPYALKEPGREAVMALPKNPSAGTQTRAKARGDLRGAEGTHNRAILEHEKSEAFMEGSKSKRSPHGTWARTQKAIKENNDVVHSSAHPLIAEANIAGRNPKALKDMRSGWSETPAQGKMYATLKQHGWTPGRGMPLYGRQANGVQQKAEKIFAKPYQKMHSGRIDSAKKRFKGKELKSEISNINRESREFAGGGK